MSRTPALPHPVYPGGPPCQPNCPGDWSEYHDGYADGYQARTAVPEIDARWSRLARLVQAAFTEWATTGARARYGETRLMNEAFALANELAATAPQEPE